ncbi:amino acid adenylation domain-containing protein [Microvirga calopogonii]|uniref:non-ribosomal peptide synthetase n=1 Tax=Microvirga calopogonii TaxID=2078013 RepID=UPI000E0D5567|nr:amino acid adenylation domain-containing protein [Microvirga calopogonii]
MTVNEAQNAGYMLSRQQRRIQSFGAPETFRALLSFITEEPIPILEVERRWAALAARHEILRTEIVTSPGLVAAMQRILPTAPWQIETLATPLSIADLIRLPFGIRIAPHGAGSCIQVVLPSLVADGTTLDLVAAAIADRPTASLWTTPSDGLPCQYADYAAWSEESLAATSAARRALAAELDTAIAAFCPPRPAALARFRPSRVATCLDPRRAVVLRAYCAETGSRPSAVFLATWVSLLRRIEGSPRLLLGLLHSGRTILALRGAAGPYDAYLPHVLGGNSGASFRDEVAALGRTMEDAQAGGVSWDDLAGHVGAAYLFAAEDADRAAEQGFALAERFVVSEPFRLALDVHGSGSTFRVALDYDAGLVSADAASRLLTAFTTLLTVLTDRPDSDPMAAAVNAPVNTQALAAAAATTALAPIPPWRTIERNGERFAQRVAVTDGVHSLSYAALNSRSNRLAHVLRARVGRPGASRVVVALERGPAMACAMLACLKAGATFVPLDPNQPLERAASILRLVEPDIAILDSNDGIPSFRGGVPVLDLRQDGGEIERQTDSTPASNVSDDRSAYIMFTSGSSGTQKGVVVGRGNLAAYLGALDGVLRLSCDDGVLQTAPAGFSSSIRQFLLPLCTGATLVVASRDEILDPLLLLRKASAHRVSVLDLIPSYWRRVLEVAEASKDGGWCQLRLALSASEPLPADLARRLLAALPRQATLVNMYGQTETAGIVACHRFDSDALVQDPVPIGEPVPGSAIVVVDDAGCRALPCQRGELVVVGPTVAHGYLGDCGRDADRFVPIGIAGQAAAFRTGDIGSEAGPDGLVLWGRADDRVKIRGFRVELAQIEREIVSHHAVEQAIVITRDDRGEAELAAHIVPKRGRRLTRAEIVAHIERSLPPYLVPTRIQFHDTLPSTPNGKVDRGALSGMKAVPVAPHPTNASAAIDDRMAALWSTVLRCRTVDRDDNFFALGGQSLLGIDLLARVSREFQVDLPFHVLYEAPTVGELAARVAAELDARDRRP